MRRRRFIALFMATASLWPIRAPAIEPGKLPLVGVLMPGSESDTNRRQRLAAFREALARAGWADGTSIRIEVRWGGEDAATFASMATELAALNPAVLFCDGTPALQALKDKATSIPIVFVAVLDPIGQGFAKSLARPGGNITGFSAFDPSLSGKWLEFLAQITPPIRRLAILYNPATAPYAAAMIDPIVEAAPHFSVTVQSLAVDGVSDIETGIAEAARSPDAGLLVLPSTFTVSHRARIIDAVAKNRLPAIYFFTYFATDGGLMSYGNNAVDQHRRAAGYIDRIIKGENPGTLPIQRPVKFDLVINLKTAKALGVTIAPSLIALADEVIE